MKAIKEEFNVVKGSATRISVLKSREVTILN